MIGGQKMFDDSEFSNTYIPKVVASSRNILGIKILEWNMDMDATPELMGEKQFLRLRILQTSDLETQIDLKKRIAEFVHIHSLENRPVTLGALNRRFGKVAKKLGTTTMEMTQQLCATGRLITIDRHGGYVAMFSGAVYQERLAHAKEEGLNINEIMDRVIENTL